MADHPLKTLLEDLDRRNVRMRLLGDQLAVSPWSGLPPELQEAIRGHKADLLELALLFGPSGLLALFSDRPLTDAERCLLAEKALELRDRLPKTENQCGQCSAWRPSSLVELGYSERVDCLADRQGSAEAFVGSAVAI